jgi:hypothetical protein
MLKVVSTQSDQGTAACNPWLAQTRGEILFAVLPDSFQHLLSFHVILLQHMERIKFRAAIDSHPGLHDNPQNTRKHLASSDTINLIKYSAIRQMLLLRFLPTAKLFVIV